MELHEITKIVETFPLELLHIIHNRTMFASSVLNLCELVSLRPDLAGLTKVLYFHENQLIYPTRKQQDRDFQYGYNQILSWYVCNLQSIIVYSRSPCCRKLGMEHMAFDVRTNTMRILSLRVIQLDSCPHIVAF